MDAIRAQKLKNHFTLIAARNLRMSFTNINKDSRSVKTTLQLLGRIYCKKPQTAFSTWKKLTGQDKAVQ